MDITVKLTDDDVKCLKNDLLDIDQWVQDAVKGKVEQCKKRMIQEWTPKLMNDPDVSTIPADEKQLIDLVVSRVDYKDRLTKEEEQKQR